MAITEDQLSFSLQNLENSYCQALQETATRAYSFCSQLNLRIECGIDEKVVEMDGLTRLRGWFKVIRSTSSADLSGDDEVVFHKTDFRCAVVSYLLYLRDVDDDFVFRSCVAKRVLDGFAFGSEDR